MVKREAESAGNAVIQGAAESKGRASGLFPVLVIALAVAVQGGFFNAITCVCGVVLGVFGVCSYIRHRTRGGGIGLVPLLFFGMACAYAISAVINGAFLSSLSETGAWFAITAMALYAGGMSSGKRDAALRKIVWLGAITAAFGLLVYGDVIPLPGGVDDSRLQFTFQYANAAAAWFAVTGLLALLCPEGKLRALAVLPIAALLLTESAGGIIAFVVACAVVCVRWLRDARRHGDVLYSLIVCLAAVIVFAVCRWFGIAGSLAALALGIAGGVVLFRKRKAIVKTCDAKRWSLILLGVIAVAGLGAFVLLFGRVSDASGNMVERFYHAKDGLALWLASPLVGIGPDQWQFAYPFIQTAQYHTTVVHNSYVQILVDAGLLGIGCLLAAAVAGIRGLLKTSGDAWRPVVGLAACVLLAHSLLDFDLQFGALALLLAFLLSDPEGPRIRLSALAAGLACCILCCFGSLVGLGCELSSFSFSLANAAGDTAQVKQLFEGNQLAEDDPACQTQYMLACYNEQDFASIAAFHQVHGAATDEQAIYASVACAQLGRMADSTNVLVDMMERQPYNDEFFDNAKTVVDLYGFDVSAVGRWNAAVDHANECEQGVSGLLHTQRTVNTYLAG